VCNMNNSEALLKLENIHKSFASVKVLDNVSLTLKKGNILGLVGENGAGKSTLMNIFGGILPKDEGKMYIDGKLYEPGNPEEARVNGISFIHQELSLFLNLSVKENIFIEDLPIRNILHTIDYRVMGRRASKILEELGEDLNVNALIGDLSMGQRQMVEIAKALTKNAKIIIFDEPTSSLSNKEKEKLFVIIRNLAQKGVSIIFISHALGEVFSICNEIMVLRDGKLIGQEKTEDLHHEKVIQMMVGRELSKIFPYKEKNRGNIVFELEHFSRNRVFSDISFQLYEGEVVGLFGLMGAGRSELVRSIFGVDPYETGLIRINGVKIRKTNPQLCKKKGMAFITENRREEGLLMTKPVNDNVVLASLESCKGLFGRIDRKKENEISNTGIEEAKVKTYDKYNQTAMQLSGGNQQKTVIAKWLLIGPKIFFLDEPTRGIDVGAKYEIYNYINQLAEGQSSILFISSEMEELIGICDRILVMCKGEITGELRRDKFDPEVLMNFAIGSSEKYA
jgi:ribose transport system ATP-binding protein